MTGHVNGRLMASRARSFANLAPILAALFLVALPAFAADCCPAATQDVNTLSVDQIRDLQKCLLQGGYYVGNNASEVDGAIGKRTLAALDKASQNCSSPAPPAPPDGNVVCCSPAIQKKIVQLHNGEELTSTEIKAVQICLRNGNFYDSDHPPAVDGILGPNTAFAVESAVESCSPEPPPAPTPQYVPPDCEDGHAMVSYVLTAADLDALKDPPKTGSGPPDPKLSPELLQSLQLMRGADYPSRELFLNALDFFTRSIDTTPPIRELIGKKACKIHGAVDTAAGWVAKSDVPMTDDLSQTTYGFYPFWQGAGTPGAPNTVRRDILPVDFSVLMRMEWFGVTFSDAGRLDLDPFIHQRDSPVYRKLALARRFGTGVDLVVYRRESPETWLNMVSDDAPGPGRDLIDYLSTSIANEVGTPLAGFLDNIQNWFPEAFRSSPTFWDGVTLYFEGYPYDDPVALRAMVDLLHKLRSKLRAQEHYSNIWKTHKFPLALNVVLPFCNLVTDLGGCKPPQDESNKLTMSYLRTLVPKTLGETDNPNSASGSSEDDIDEFIVFLPQSTSTNKMALRESIERAFTSVADKKSLDTGAGEYLADWRKNMLRKMTYVLFPATWKLNLDYRKPGSQFYDDMSYAQDNFWGIGLWPSPVPGADDPKLAADIRDVFKRTQTDLIDRWLAPLFAGIPGFANFFLEYRRELFVFVSTLALLLTILGICAFWIIELRQFFTEHFWWFVAVAVLIVAILGFEFLFNQDLRNYATPFGVVLVIVFLLGMLVRRTYLGTVKKDLP
jgi:hypothetical protein